MRQNKNAINWFLPLFILLSQYNIVWGYSLGLISMLGFSIISFFRHKSIAINKPTIAFVWVCILSQILIHSSFFGITTFIIIFLSLIMQGHLIDEKKLYFYYKIFGSIAILGLLYHSVLFYYYNLDTEPIKILPIADDIVVKNWYYGPRPKSFFSEPQAYASYMMPFLFLSLKFKELKWALLITISVILSTSSQGIAMLGILWIGYIFFNVRTRLRKISLTIIVLGIALFYILSPVFEFSRNKIMSTNLSEDVRLSRGFQIYYELTNVEKLVGIGYGNIGEYVYNHSQKFSWSRGNTSLDLLGYTTGISGILIQFGIIAFIFFIFMIIRYLRRSDKSNIAFIILIIASYFFQNLVINAYFLYFFIFLIGTSKDYTIFSFKSQTT